MFHYLRYVSLGAVIGGACDPAVAGRPHADAGEGETGTDTDEDREDHEGDDGGATFGPEREFTLRLADDDVPPLSLSMNREEVAELFGERADDVLLLELNTTALLTNALEELKGACGVAWRQDDEDPQHNCDLTPLGSSFAGPDGSWQTSAEYAMVRSLTMTPANVDVSGTSSSSLASLANALGVGGGYSQILADALGIPRTEEIVSTEALVQALQRAFVDSHPAFDNGTVLGVYLSDALSSLETLTERLGPQGDHPGLVDPTVAVFGEVFGPQFRMNTIAESNLRLVDGIDADVGKGFLTVVADRTGPTFDDELEFDFADDERFSLDGILDDLRIDIRFQLQEDDTFIQSCLGSPPCTTNLPGNPVDAGSIWSRAPWSLEYNVALAAYYDYRARVYDESYLLGAASVEIGQNGNPPGWVEYWVPLGIGSPPEDQFVWETVLEVAQVALHRTPFMTFGEGDADVAFTVQDIPIGITGQQAAEAVRPYLQEQAEALSDFILGDYKQENDRVDVFWRRGEDGHAYLHFVDPTDLAEDANYTHDRPGLFDDPSLSPGSKVSQLVIAGLSDTRHEKFNPRAGETVVYFEDDRETLFRLRIVRASDNDGELQVFVAEAT